MSKLINSNIIIAPMAGITNNAFLKLLSKLGAKVAIKEMISDNALNYGSLKSLEMLKKESIPNMTIGIQIFGSSELSMTKAAIYIDKHSDYDFIDINMGCPVPKITKQKAGASLMLDEELAVRIVASIIRNVKKPVSVKMRLGYNSQNINCLSLARKLEAIGVFMITIHARTRADMYGGSLLYEEVLKVKKALKIPVVVNGDIKSLDDYKRLKELGFNKMMIGRALVAKPYLVSQLEAYEKNEEIKEIKPEFAMQLMRDHFLNLIELKGEKMACLEFRGIAAYYLNGFKNATKYKRELVKINSKVDFLKIIDEIIADSKI